MNRWLIVSAAVLIVVSAGLARAQERVVPPALPAPPPAQAVPLPPAQGPGPGGALPPGTFPRGLGSGQPNEAFKELVPALIDALKDTDGDIRTNAAAALANIGREAITPMLDILKDKNEDRDLRANIVQVFAQMGGTANEALPTLMKCLKDKSEDKEVRRRVSFALVRICKESGNAGYGMPGGFPGMMPGFPGGSGATQQEPVIKPADPGLLLPSKIREK